MRALTLSQPYAQLCVLLASLSMPPRPLEERSTAVLYEPSERYALKEFETRSWATAYRGPLAIHAGKGPGFFTSEAALWERCLIDPFRKPLLDAGFGNPGRLPRGAVVGQVELVAIYRIHADCLEDVEAHGVIELPGEPERSFGDYTPGRYAWYFASPRAYARPIPARGLMGLWEWESPQ